MKIAYQIKRLILSEMCIFIWISTIIVNKSISGRFKSQTMRKNSTNKQAADSYRCPVESDSPSGRAGSADHQLGRYIHVIVVREPVLRGELVARITHPLIETVPIRYALTGEDLDPSRAS
jgi:hypothetical protein